MEPNKIEKQFKEQLNSREINPSEMSWSKLEGMLNLAEEKPKHKYWWLYVAASIVGILLVSTVYFNSAETLKINQDTPLVLEERQEKNKVNDSELENLEVLGEENQKESKNNPPVIAGVNLKTQPKQLSNILEKVSIVPIPKGNNEAVSSSDVSNESATSSNLVSAQKLLAEVTDATFETKVTENLSKKNRIAISVKPKDLLVNAETELNQSFRESALDKFSKNVKVIKTALVNRNYEE